MSDWLRATVKVSGKQIQSALDAFEDMGALAITQQNAGEDDYYDLAHPAEPGWQHQQVIGLFNDDVDQSGIKAELQNRISDQLDVDLQALADQDWETAWTDRYQPTQINQSLWVYPSWIEADPAHQFVLRIDPGLAFGTGTHPTTALCLDALSEMSLDQARVMDYGCGSGILAVAALLLGAQSAVGLDIDPKAEVVALENAELNGVSERFTIQSARDHSGQTYDVLIANILAGALIDLSESIAELVKPGGRLLLSGILVNQADSVVAAYQDRFHLSVKPKDEWVLITAEKFTN